MLSTVQVQRDVESFHLRLVAPAHHSGIIPIRHGMSCAFECRMIKVVQDQRFDCPHLQVPGREVC